MITYDRLKEVLNYDPVSGIFTWKIALSSRTKIGAVAGTIKDTGYLRITIDGKKYLAHRLAWLYIYGKFPDLDLDHKDITPLNNAQNNLREATKSQNQKNSKIPRNNKSGVKGVHWASREQKWVATAKLNGVLNHLGYFDDIEKASLARSDFCKKHHGEFYNAT